MDSREKIEVLRAYLYLVAYEKKGASVTTFDIHEAWIQHCRGDDRAGEDILGCAMQEGFRPL